MKAQFADVKKGDKVWSINHGWGKVTSRHSTTFCVYHETKNKTIWYTLNGERRYKDDQGQTLFWDEITVTPPPKPQREVVHEVERWVNVYANGKSLTYICEEAANDDRYIFSDRIACVKLTGTYTTME
jgi:hypothetical protein